MEDIPLGPTPRDHVGTKRSRVAHAPGICRICRCEGTVEEPLYYPCRCSGSIQHVHQDCLMQWLSHSQKRYCELCMTPYRFTKFYNPNMPASLPLSVFLEKSARYALANSLSWLRAGVAIGFWLIALPFFMRRGWSYMFWLSRESWTNNRSLPPFLHGNKWGDSIQLSSTTLGLDTCPASPLFNPTTTPAKSLAENMRISAQGQGQTFSGSLLQGLYWTMGWKDGPTPPKSDSLLSNVKFFKGNETLIDVMEGQIITIVVIVSFILIILVRDYVVQQQPELNLREGAERDQQAGEQAPVAVQPAHIPDVSDSEDDGEEEDTPQGPPLGHEHEHEHEHEQPPRADSPLPGDWTSDAAENTPGTTSSGFGSDVADYNGSDVANLTPSDRSVSPIAPDSPRFQEPSHGLTTTAQLQPDAGPSRQRSVSDGAQINTSVNPLANNTWSFDAAPSINQGLSNSGEPAGPHDHEASSGASRDQESIGANVDVRQDRTIPAREPAAHSVDNTNQDAEQLGSQSPQNTAGGITGFMYGDIEGRYQEIAAQPQAVADDGDHAVEWEDVPMDGEGDLPGPIPGQAHDEGLQDPAVAAAQDNDVDNDGVLDVEAIEDMEDFEGIMDLLGMRGPVTNLFQNVIFCSVLVQSALTLCVFIPFNVGRVFFWFIDRPDRLLRILYEMSKVVQDVTFIFAGAISWCVINLVDMITERIGGALAAQVVHARKASFELAIASGKRVGHFLDLFLTDVFATGTAMQQWSATSHGSLINIKGRAGLFFTVVGQLFGAKSESTREAVGSLPSNTSSLHQWTAVDTTGLVDPKLAFWPSADITLAVFAGYFFIIIAAALYVKSGIRFTRGSALEEWENGFVDTLHQASGIFKVITIISIEMLVFPLYCGLLLDCALLPLFNGASLTSRLLFTRNNPWTSVFVHWFVGTGYMFHFALFVSMCRKIMRPGVLYFIRDPDDPDFHPVRDVLDRNLATQLRKIMFSAFVYGALVIVCLGGVVWGLALAAPPILPIHYSSNEPILEFPLDLLFYNFFMPFSLKLLQPDQNLLVLFKWCFRKSARMLRLTYFLFGQRRLAEEGTLRSSKYADGSMEGWLFLDLGRKQDRVKDKSWRDLFDGIDSERVYNPSRRGMRKKEIKKLNETKAKLVEEGSLVPDGRFVRAPATDRIKIPKGTDVFLTVNEDNERQDGKASEDIYSSPHFKMTYIPPHFLRRIFAFILLIWTFAAIIGVGATIIPLILGRFLFKMALPEHVRTNDVYAFCIGFHIFGYGLYALDTAWKNRSTWNVIGWMTEKLKSINSTAGFVRAAKMVYAYTFILVVCPLAIAVLVELYINLPLHSVLHPPGKADAAAGKSQHHVRIIELWTMGLLYMRLLVKLSHSFLRNSRFNLAREGILIQGWLNPNINLLTRAFVAPGLLLVTAAVLAPPCLVAVLEKYGFFPAAVVDNPELVAERILRYRHAYPVVAFFTISAKYGTLLRHSFDSLKAQVRDDTYLMGERLQNYDGSPAQASTSTQPTAAE